MRKTISTLLGAIMLIAALGVGSAAPVAAGSGTVTADCNPTGGGFSHSIGWIILYNNEGQTGSKEVICIDGRQGGWTSWDTSHAVQNMSGNPRLDFEEFKNKANSMKIGLYPDVDTYRTGCTVQYQVFDGWGFSGTKLKDVSISDWNNSPHVEPYNIGTNNQNQSSRYRVTGCN